MRYFSRSLSLILFVFALLSFTPLIVPVTPVQAQQSMSLGNINFSKLNVDQMSDAQLRQLLQRMKSQGVSVTQLTSIALSRGMPSDQVQKLRQRLEMLQSGSGPTNRADSLQQGPLRRQILQQLITSKRFSNLPDSLKADSILTLLGDTTNQLNKMNVQPPIQFKSKQDSLAYYGNIYGFSLFNTKTLSFAPSLNIPTPQDYQLGPGDQVIINVWGAAQATYTKTISPEGTINISNLAPIHLDGLTIGEAQKRVIHRLIQIYSGLNPNDPRNHNTFADLTLGNIRTISVTLLGDVRTPGTYTLSALSTVFNALYVSGGPSRDGSFRNIQLIRNGKIYKTIDVYDFLVNGKTDGNVRLQDQDIIKINSYTDRVYISGQVNRSMLFEIKPGETMADLIRFAGGFTNNAYKKRVEVYRNTNIERKILDVTSNQFDTFHPENGDHIIVSALIKRFTNRARIKGAVYKPGQYEVTDTSTVYGLIKRAEGLKEDAYLPRGLIYRETPDLQLEVVPFNVGRMMKDPADYNLPLKPHDVVNISSIFDMKADYSVQIKGAVQHPGVYPYMQNMTLSDLIMQANGLNESATPRRVEVARRIDTVDVAKEMNNIAKIYYFNINKNLVLEPKGRGFKLEPFDQVYVRTAPNYYRQERVYVGGQVWYPGTYVIKSKSDNIYDMIKRAGGLTPEAYPTGAKLIRTQSQLFNRLGHNGVSDTSKTKGALSGPIGIDLPKILAKPQSKYDLLVQSGDSLLIPKKLETVKVQGQVMFPVNVRYDQHFSFNDYISQAGGYTSNALKKRAYVIYANGGVDRVHNFLFIRSFPKIEPGSRIVIPPKPNVPPVTVQERIGIISAIMSTTLTLTTTIVILGQKLGL